MYFVLYFTRGTSVFCSYVPPLHWACIVLSLLIPHARILRDKTCCLLSQLQYLPPPWGDCKSTPIDSEYFSTYSITACRIDCETRYLLENCNCRMVHMPGTAPPPSLSLTRSVFIIISECDCFQTGTSTVCTPEQYKDCADPALGEPTHFYRMCSKVSVVVQALYLYRLKPNNKSQLLFRTSIVKMCDVSMLH